MPFAICWRWRCGRGPTCSGKPQLCTGTARGPRDASPCALWPAGLPASGQIATGPGGTRVDSVGVEPRPTESSGADSLHATKVSCAACRRAARAISKSDGIRTGSRLRLHPLGPVHQRVVRVHHLGVAEAIAAYDTRVLFGLVEHALACSRIPKQYTMYHAAGIRSCQVTRGCRVTVRRALGGPSHNAIILANA
jgi:hypothetical protein